MAPPPERAVQISALTDLDRYNTPARPGSTEPAEPFSVRLAKLYLKTSVELIDKLRAGSDAGDVERIRFAAHTLKSGTAMVGAAHLAATLAEVEKRAREGSLEGIAGMVDAIEEEYLRVRGELVEYVGPA